MKNVILLLMLFVNFSANAQAVFGIDINTTRSVFNGKMKQKGYIPFEKVSGMYRYKVTFAGFKGAIAEMEYDTRNDSIINVKVRLVNRSKNENESAYYTLLKQFKEKYSDGRSWENSYKGKHCVVWRSFLSKENRSSVWLYFSDTDNEMYASYIPIYEYDGKDKGEISNDI